MRKLSEIEADAFGMVAVPTHSGFLRQALEDRRDLVSALREAMMLLNGARPECPPVSTQASRWHKALDALRARLGL